MSAKFKYLIGGIFFSIGLFGVVNGGEVDSRSSEREDKNSQIAQNSPKLFVFADVEGRFELLRQSLITHGLADETMNWIGGSATLVVYGNFTSGIKKLRTGVDIFKKLQDSASSQGAVVQLVLGENDVDLILTNYVGEHNDDQLTLNALTWLLNQDYIVKHFGQAITNGGISFRMKGREVEEVNTKLKASLNRYLNRWQALLETGAIDRKLSLSERFTAASALKNSQEAITFLKSSYAFVNSNTWPVRYQGSSFCHPLFERENIDVVSEQWGIDRFWSASTRFAGDGPESRFDGRMIFLDSTHQLSSRKVDSKDHLWGAEIEANGNYKLLNAGTILDVTTKKIVDRHYSLPYGMSAKEIEDFLRTAEVVEKAETVEGRTKPLKIRLEKDGKSMKAIFKFVNKSGRKMERGVPRTGDKYDYEMAAYHLSNMLDIGLVPIVVERAVANKRGAVQLWIDGLISAIPINTGEARYEGECNPDAQENMMNTFDYLIMNLDRNQTNITFTKADWQIWFIDHTRSFGVGTRVPPFLKDVKVTPTRAFKEKLRGLDKESMKTLRTWLSESQVETLWERRNKLLESEFILE